MPASGNDNPEIANAACAKVGQIRMNRTGLAIAFATAVVVGVVFGVFPRLDLAISAFFFDPHTGLFEVNAQPWVNHTRAAARYLIALLVAPAFLGMVGKVLLPRRRLLLGGRGALLLIATLALGPGLLTNVILKDHWGRSRPIDVKELGGAGRFTPWWDPSGDCLDNCSFVAGEASGAFWTLAPAALAPPQWRALAYGGALTFGTAIGLLRIAGGGHFFTDVAFAGVFTFLLIWLAHGLIFRWKPTRLTDDAVEWPFVKAGEALRTALAAILPGRKGKTGKLS
jgi:lipid A 4'-phosphatase